jgi:uncharacterized protein YihD (DUF1040 family)
MKDSKRIERVLALLGQYWRRYPDLRLGQIVSNLTPDNFGQDPYHVEDDR